MDSDEEVPDDLRVRLTWPQPSGSGAPFDPGTADTPPGGLPPAEASQPLMAPAPREPVPRNVPNYGAEPTPGAAKEPTPGRRGLGRWAADRRAAAQRAADAREQAARAAAERAAAERAEAKRVAAERAAAKRTGDPRGARPSGQPFDASGRTQEIPVNRAGRDAQLPPGAFADPAQGRAAADRAATEAAQAQWAAAEAARA